MFPKIILSTYTRRVQTFLAEAHHIQILYGS